MKAPVPANWLLIRLMARPEADAIAGDLMEQSRNGRSELWFWRQVLAAIGVFVWRGLYTHKKVSLSGILVGMVSLWCLAALTTGALSSMGLLVHALDWQWPHYVQLTVVAFLYSSASGWIVGRFHRAHRAAAVFAFFVFVLATAPLEFALYYALAPSIFFSTILPHLPFLVISSLLCAPSILIGGFSEPQTARG